MRRPAVLVLAAVAGLSVPVAVSPVRAAVEVNLEVVGHSQLGGGPWDDVAVAGRTAVVTEKGAACATGAAVLVDLADPRHPRPAGPLPLPAGVTVVDVAAVAVSTPALTGDLLAVAFSSCSAGPPGVLYYEVTDAAGPRLLARLDRDDARAVSLAVRPDGRVVSAVANPTTVLVDDVTDPARPVALARWVRPPSDARGDCAPAAAGVTLSEAGDRAVAVFGDSGIYDLDLADPARIVLAGYAGLDAGGGRPSAAAVLPVGRRTVAVVSEVDAACADPPPSGRGLRLLALDRQRGPADAGALRLPSPAAPGRLAASGELAFVAWHADGLRVVDLGQVTPRVTAQFVPPAADVVGVAVRPDDVLVVDLVQGLYVLRRPDEGKAESLGQKIKNAAGFIAFPVAAGLLLTVPRLVMGHQGARSRSGAPVPARVPRRRR